MNNKEEFYELLKRAQLNKRQFADKLGASAGTISNWGNEERDIPYWVKSWLELYIENMQCKKIKEALSESGVCDLMDKKSK